jgi:hypothetical protein
MQLTVVCMVEIVKVIGRLFFNPAKIILVRDFVTLI